MSIQYNPNAEPYSPQKDLNNIVYSKGVYTSGDAGAKIWAENNAASSYENLRKNGYGHLADQYAAMGTAEAYSTYKSTYSRPNDYITSDEDYEKVLGNYRNALNNAANMAAESNMAYYNSMTDGINRKYDDSSRALQLNYMKDANNLNRSLAVSGITGGMSESAQLQALAGYQGNLNQNELARNDYLNQLEFQKAQVERDKNMQYAQNEITATDYARSAYESDRNHNMLQDQFDRQMHYDYYRSYMDDLYRERDFNEGLRQWNIENARAAEDHEFQSKLNTLSFAVEAARYGDLSLLKVLLPGVSDEELIKRVNEMY